MSYKAYQYLQKPASKPSDLEALPGDNNSSINTDGTTTEASALLSPLAGNPETTESPGFGCC